MATVRELSRRETQAKVLREADALFQARGFASTTIRDIAAAAGVSLGTVMAVGDKNALLVKIFDRHIEGLHNDRPARGEDGTSQASQIMALLDPFIDLFTSRHQLARTYASILIAGNHSSAIFTELASMLIEEIRCVVGGNVPGSEALARAIYLTYLGSLFAWTADSNSDSTALAEQLRGTITVICPS